MPNYDQITGWIRVGVPAVVAFLAGHGITTNWWENDLIWLGVAGAALVWDHLNNSTGKVIGK